MGKDNTDRKRENEKRGKGNAEGDDDESLFQYCNFR
jgi:hypothetical protein